MAIASRELNAEPDLQGSGSVTKWSAVRPLVLLASLFAAELIALSVWLDTSTLPTQSTLLAGIGTYGSRMLRVVVGFSALFVTFSFLRYRVLPGARRIRWSLLCLHLAAMMGFAGVSLLLFAGSGSLARSNLAALAWLADGLCAIALAALAFIPLDDWMEMIRTTGFLWIYALAGAVTMAFAGDIVKSIWRPLWNLTSQMVAAMLRIFVSPVVLDPASLTIRTPHFEVQVSRECAGFEGLGLILAFSVIFLVLFRKECRFPQALLLLPAGL